MGKKEAEAQRNLAFFTKFLSLKHAVIYFKWWMDHNLHRVVTRVGFFEEHISAKGVEWKVQSISWIDFSGRINPILHIYLRFITNNTTALQAFD